MKILKYNVLILFCVAASITGYSQTKNCLLCDFKMPSESSKPGGADPCFDLFEASCMGADGKSKFQGDPEKLSNDMLNTVKEARDKTAKEMGFKNIDDAIKNKLKSAGIDLRDNIDDKAFKNLKNEDGTLWQTTEDSRKIYSSVEQCVKDEYELMNASNGTLDGASALKDLIKKYEAFNLKYHSLTIKLYAKDIPNFVNNNIATQCKQLKNSSHSYKPDENQKALNACENFEKIKRQAIELYRLEGTADYDKKAEEFVQKNIPSELQSNNTPFASKPTKTQGIEKTETEKLRETIEALEKKRLNVCPTLSSVTANVARKVVQDFFEKVSKSKTTVDSLIEAHYNESRKKQAALIFNSAKADIQDLVGAFVKDNQKRGDILDGYDSLELFWMEKPKDSAYSTIDGIKFLDIEKANTKGLAIVEAFSDPSLSFFRELNAFYTASGYERVTMMPAFLHVLEKNPYSFLSVVAHEVGHKIGPMVSKVKDYDLGPEYRELLNCYKDSKSIKLKEVQTDEVIADYISSEVLARQIQKLPSEKRKQALMSSVELYCLFDQNKHHLHSISCTSIHPENSLRVSGIYGSNPSIRKIMGCEKDSPKFKTCGLKTSILNIPEVGPAKSENANSKPKTDSETNKGVR